ncbi:hypothetical protein AVEN_260861-1 [Araneus ventricosus]|uniref:Uncharacterized protein n=1 Tax=Araneus ventricosus TaxID=182803 RepID=A0A4Y2M2J7_ARAVE|nr:hypothetical protein AVEN_260861-1 [Araneus ventricosus]
MTVEQFRSTWPLRTGPIRKTKALWADDDSVKKCPEGPRDLASPNSSRILHLSTQIISFQTSRRFPQHERESPRQEDVRYADLEDSVGFVRLYLD